MTPITPTLLLCWWDVVLSANGCEIQHSLWPVTASIYGWHLSFSGCSLLMQNKHSAPPNFTENNLVSHKEREAQSCIWMMIESPKLLVELTLCTVPFCEFKSSFSSFEIDRNWPQRQSTGFFLMFKTCSQPWPECEIWEAYALNFLSIISHWQLCPDDTGRALTFAEPMFHLVGITQLTHPMSKRDTMDLVCLCGSNQSARMLIHACEHYK